jgi:hypothetical protein
MIQYCAEYRDCPDCGDERLFEAFHAADCPDHPGLDCPEVGCADCGTALIIGVVVPGYTSGDSVSQAA